MQQLDLSFTLTPALALTALVFDVGLVLLGVIIVRHLRDRRPPSGGHLPSDPLPRG